MEHVLEGGRFAEGFVSVKLQLLALKDGEEVLAGEPRGVIIHPSVKASSSRSTCVGLGLISGSRQACGDSKAGCGVTHFHKEMQDMCDDFKEAPCM